MSFIRALVLLLALPSVAFAQIAPPAADPVLLQHAIGSIQAQRNQALDSAAVYEAKLAQVTDELAKAKAKIKDFEDKATAVAKTPDKK